MNDAILLLLTLSLSGSLMALLVYLLSRMGRRHLPQFVLYYAWVIVALRFVLPIASPISLPALQDDFPTESVVQREQTPVQMEQADKEFHSAVVSPVQRDEFVHEPSAQVQETLPEVPLSAPSLSWNWEEIFLIVWFAGAAAVLAYAGISYTIFLRRVLPGCRRPDGEDLALLRELEPRGRVRLLVHEKLASPLYMGILRPTILIPGSYCKTGKREQLRAILSHELTHYHRRDLAVKYFTLLVSAIHWFNPLMILVRRQLHRYCEFSCDEAVLQKLDSRGRTAYGDSLIDTALQALTPAPLGVMPFSHKDTLRERVVHISRFRTLRPAPILLSVILLLTLAGCAAVVGPLQETNPEESETVIGGADMATSILIADPIILEPASYDPETITGDPLNYRSDPKKLSDRELAKLDPEKNYTLPSWFMNSDVQVLNQRSNRVDFPTAYASGYYSPNTGEEMAEFSQEHIQQGEEIASVLFQADETETIATESGHDHIRYLSTANLPEGCLEQSLESTCTSFIYRAEWDNSEMLAYEKQIEENGGLAPYKEFDDVLDVDELMEILWAYAQKLGLEDVLPSGRYYDIYEDQGAVYSYQICFYEHADGLPVVTLKGEQPVFLRAKVLYGRLVEVQYTPPALERYSFDNRYAPLDVHGALEHLNYYNQSNTFYSYETPPLNPKAYATLTEAYPVLALQYWCTQQARPNGTIYHHDYYYVPAWCFTFHTAHDPNAYMYAYVNALTGEPFLQPESGSVHFAPKEDKGS